MLNANSSEQETLGTLLLAVAREDRAAFARLYRLSSPKLFSVLLRILRNRAQAEECLQESYLKIWQHARDYVPERGSPLAWMATIARHRALDLLRRHTEQTHPDPQELQPVHDWDVEEALVGHSSRELRALRQCLEALEPGMRKAVLLAYYEGLSHAELAARMTVPLGTAKTWIRRGLLRLRGCLDEC